ncbi:hypothetical protein [Vampirovibrio sp.]|uniref:hypothetical protein n=1 Tax=Vampirovibrio sp. TaxID=2717857 RepID=UPI003593CAA3
MFPVTPLTNPLVENTDASFLIDTIHPGAPLLISFGFVDWQARPAFDFYGRVKKLEATTQRPLNRVLVRDCSNGWYHREIPGLGQHVDAVAESLGQVIAMIQPSVVITIGQSMGGYAAILFGILLNVDRILSFGPLSFLTVAQALTYHDRRWLSVMLDLQENPPPVQYLDLPTLFRERHCQSDLRIFFGTQPNAGATESVNLDVLHAFRYAALPQCQLFPYPHSGHAVVQHLIDQGQMDRVLAQHILDLDLPESPAELVLSETWVSWVEDNLRLGGNPVELIQILKQHGFTEAEGQSVVQRFKAP